MSEYIQVVTTIDSKEKAEKIAALLVDSGLAACAQISGEIKSIYRWKGKIEESTEYYIVVKTKRVLYSKVEELIKKHHSYEVPEIIAINIESGYRPYIDWIEAQVADK